MLKGLLTIRGKNLPSSIQAQFEESMTGRILIVDDVATNRIVMKVKLVDACYTVDQADSGAAALRPVDENRPDLIILDVLMPDMSGLEVCRGSRRTPTGRHTRPSGHGAQRSRLEDGGA
jgi:CheY-like chemotaxis protein